MLIQGTLNTDRNNLLIKKYIDLIHSGIDYDEILVLLLNPYKKALFLDSLKKYIPNIESEKLKIYTTNGLCYNAFMDNLEYIKSILNYNNDEHPNLCGLEVSQYIFKQSIKEADFKDYISKVNLLHQLFRRYSLIVQNNLSNNEVIERSKLLNESFYKDAQKAINDYKSKTIDYKSFDYLRQLAVFSLIYKNTDYFKNIKYLILNDADEISYAIWEFIYHIIPNLEDWSIGYDKDGSTRCGYLCAYKSGIEELKSKVKTKETTIADKSPFFEISNQFSSNIRGDKKTQLNDFIHKNSLSRLDMIDCMISDIELLIDSGVKPNEIQIVTPIVDEVLAHTLNERKNEINFQIISGNSKLSDIKIIKYIIYILKAVNDIKLKDFELRSLFSGLLKIPLKKCLNIIKNYQNIEVLDCETENEQYKEKITKLKSIIKSLRQHKKSVSEQIKIIYSNLIEKECSLEDKKKFDFLLKEAESFELAFSNIKNIEEEFIIQIENSVISENPINSFSLNKNAIIVASPQKIIDYDLKTKYQFWLDISNGEWFKQDTGTLYNSWVLNRDWTKNEYTLEDEMFLTRDKAARIIRKLMLCSQKEIRFYSSLYDNSGIENFSGLVDFIHSKQDLKTEFKIMPRDDQKPVLEYKKGKMGIMAVPGAGKTTILLALIIKLIKDGTPPNNIFVLTYMESAAKNFKERIKQSMPDTAELPNISTIHGLALRIIKENGNYTKVGLDENFEICDDSEKERIIKELFFKLKISDDKYDNYLKSISTVKLSGNTKKLSSKYQDIQEFYTFLYEYNKTLKEHNLIDYDDMLFYAIQILSQHKEIAKYYQNICKYIIEDEAQDSSDIQQYLINLLAKEHNNIVRCGDINQSITSTFTNSNLAGFKNFIKENHKVEMVSSQRCAKPIYSLANKIINISSSDETIKNAFYPIEMKGTKNNPESEKSPEFITFDNEKEEKNFILNKIKEIKKNNPNSSIAILLRLNNQVNDYNEFLNTQGLKTSIRSDCLSQKIIYKYIYRVLNIIENPLNNKLIIELLELYRKKYPQNISDEALLFMNELKKPFINIDADELTNELLLQLYWDIDYWLNNSDSQVEELSLKIGLYYSQNMTDKSNTYLVSTFIKRLKSNNDNTKELLEKLDYNSQKSLSSIKFFEDNNDKETEAINIMTMHKSKGDEFDFVFIPQLNEENYSTRKDKVKLKNGSHFIQTIKHAVMNSEIKTPDELKQEQVEETLRLLYVGITRAKKELYLSNASNYKTRKNTISCDFVRKIMEKSLEKNSQNG